MRMPRDRLRRWLWPAYAPAVVLAFGLVLSGSPAVAAQCDTVGLSAVLIGDADVPQDYLPVPEATGPGDVLPWTSASAVRELCSYERVWVDEDEIVLQGRIVDLRTDRSAARVLGGATAAMVKQSLSRFDVPDVAHASGAVVPVPDGTAAEPLEGATVLFRRGRYVFGVTAVTVGGGPRPDTARALAATQAAKAPPGRGAPSQPLTNAEFVGRVSGSLIVVVALYLLAITAVARRRDPLAISRFRKAGRSAPAARDDRVRDVSPGARRVSRRAHARFALQIFGLCLVIPGFLPGLWPASLAAAGSGLLFAWGLPWWLRRRARRRGVDEGTTNQHRVFTGRRPVRVAIWSTAAMILVGAGALMAAVVGVMYASDEPLLVPGSSGENAELPAAVVGLPGVAAAVALVAGGVGAQRRARRFAALDARTVMERDGRPMVLYLRSFSDDDIKVRTATARRRSLVEQLSPRRFDRFEEVVAWQLNQLGPVVALNPPDTKLSPVGAARTTLAHEEWKTLIQQWMQEAAAIVVAAPPLEVTEGLRWELDEIDDQAVWSKTAFVWPPVPDAEVRSRWAGLEPALAELSETPGPLPADPAVVLAATLVPGGGWSVITAHERTEWSYAEALSELIARLRSARDVVGAEAQPLVGHGRST